MSAIKSSEKYELSKLPGSLEEYSVKNGGDFKKNPVNIAEMIRDARKLGMINEELDKISSLTGKIDDQLKDKLQTLKRRAQAKLYSENVAQQQA